MGIVTKFCILMDKLADAQQNKTDITKFDNLSFKENKNIVYYELAKDGCTLNTIVLDDGKVHPVCLLIHGGSFVAGDKYYRRGLAKWLAANNYFVVNISYGLGPKYLLDDQVTHIGKAIEWIQQNAVAYNYDLNNAIVYGDSAGGYHATIASLLTLDKILQDKYGVNISLKFKKAVLICGIYDFKYAFTKKWYVKGIGKSLLKDVIGSRTIKKYKGNHELINLLDLIPSNFPETIVSYSQKDILCGGQTQLLMKKFNELNIDYKEVHSTKLLDNHCYSLSWKSKAAREANNTIKEFIK